MFGTQWPWLPLQTLVLDQPLKELLLFLSVHVKDMWQPLIRVMTTQCTSTMFRERRCFWLCLLGLMLSAISNGQRNQMIWNLSLLLVVLFNSGTQLMQARNCLKMELSDLSSLKLNSTVLHSMNTVFATLVVLMEASMYGIKNKILELSWKLMQVKLQQ